MKLTSSRASFGYEEFVKVGMRYGFDVYHHPIERDAMIYGTVEAIEQEEDGKPYMILDGNRAVFFHSVSRIVGPFSSVGNSNKNP